MRKFLFAGILLACVVSGVEAGPLSLFGRDRGSCANGTCVPAANARQLVRIPYKLPRPHARRRVAPLARVDNHPVIPDSCSTSACSRC
jgi:hypothetical protein